MFEEIIATIVDILIANKKAMTVEQIMEDSGFDNAHVFRALTLLKELDLITKIASKNGDIEYKLVLELKGIHLAKAAQIGVDLSSFDGHFVINQKEKKLALEIATKAEKIKHLDVSKRKPLMQKRSYFELKDTNDITENLMVLLEASSESLYDYLEKISIKDKYLQLLLKMHDEAETSLQDYYNSLK